MNENVLKDILAEICEEEIAELNSLPAFKPSLRHKLAMKRIFASFEKNSRKPASDPAQFPDPRRTPLNLGKRLIIIAALIACAALLTGFIAVYISKSFHGTVYTDNTRLFAIDAENCLTTIEYKYYLSELPEGFEMVKHDSSRKSLYTLYKNISTGQVITLDQYTKDSFSTHYNTEHHDFEEIEVNGHNGVCLDFSDNEHYSSIVIWDNDDYILQLDGNLSKNELIKLAKSAKVLEN